MRILIFIVALFLAGCNYRAPDEVQTEVPDTTATFLGTVDGCKLWRVHAVGYGSFNFAHCADTATTATQVQSGKTSHEEDVVTDHIINDGTYGGSGGRAP